MSTRYRLINVDTGAVLAGPSHDYGHIEACAGEIESRDDREPPQLQVQRSVDGGEWRDAP